MDMMIDPPVANRMATIDQAYRIYTLINRSNQLLADLWSGVTLEETLLGLAEAAESCHEGLMASISLADEKSGMLRQAAAPNLPEKFMRETGLVPIRNGAGCCGTAAFRKEAVYCDDMLSHPHWGDYASVIKQTNLRACWSHPIMLSTTHAAGTFALYHTAPRQPDLFEVQILEACSRFAACALRANDVRKTYNDAFIRAGKANIAQPRSLMDAGNEIGAILKVLKNILWIMEEAGSRHEQCELLTILRHSADTLAGLADDIVDRLVLQEDKVSLRQQPVDVADFIVRAADRFAIMARSQGLGFICEICPEVHCTAVFDPRVAGQILGNLFRYACDSSKSGSVTLRASAIRDVNDAITLSFSIADLRSGLRSGADETLIFRSAYVDGTAYEFPGEDIEKTRTLAEFMGGEILFENRETTSATLIFRSRFLPARKIIQGRRTSSYED